MRLNHPRHQARISLIILFNLVLEEILPHVEQLDSSYEISNKIQTKVLAYANDVYIRGREILKAADKIPQLIIV